jgi:hypothetical protein
MFEFWKRMFTPTVREFTTEFTHAEECPCGRYFDTKFVRHSICSNCGRASTLSKHVTGRWRLRGTTKSVFGSEKLETLEFIKAFDA